MSRTAVGSAQDGPGGSACGCGAGRAQRSLVLGQPRPREGVRGPRTSHGVQPPTATRTALCSWPLQAWWPAWAGPRGLRGQPPCGHLQATRPGPGRPWLRARSKLPGCRRAPCWLGPSPWGEETERWRRQAARPRLPLMRGGGEQDRPLALDSRPGLSLSGPRRCYSHWPARLGPGPPRGHRGRGAGRSGPVERPRQRPLPSAGPSGPGTEAPGDVGLEQPRCHPGMTRPAGQSEKVPGGSTHRPRWTLRRGSCPLPFLKKIHRGPGVRHEREAAARSPMSGDEAHPLLERRSGRGGGPAGHVRPA